MNLIAQRPSNWISVIGQQRPIEVLQAALKHQKFLSRGLILHGVVGVGKTTVAYLLAKALMCTGQDYLGCGKCPSCELIQTGGIDNHPDFKDVHGAAKPGVDAAREIVESSTSLPVLGRRRIIVIDEAHFLSPEAWGAYLKTLEAGDTDAVFIFVTNQVNAIQANIRSRCIRVQFDRVPDAVLVGHLASVAAKNDIAYELDALRLIVRQAKGVVRDAVQYLNTCAALGVTVDANVVKTCVDTSLEDLCEKLLLTIAAKDQIEAIKLADELVRKDLPGKAAEHMLSLYSRAIYTKDEVLNKIYVGLPDVGKVADVLVKWAAVHNAPADVITIIVYELLKTQPAARPPQTRDSNTQLRDNKTSGAAPTPQAKRSPLASLLDDEAV